METLHSVLLGPYKYFLRKLIARLSKQQKEEVQAILNAFNFSGFKVKLGAKLFKHHKSFVGRNFKAVAQCGLFVFRDYYTPQEKTVWLALSQVSPLVLCNVTFMCLLILEVFKIAYCDRSVQAGESYYSEVCKNFVDAVGLHFPDFMNKAKIHLLLHLPQNLVDFGPTAAFNTERYSIA